jgi:hypothetical protein
MAFSPTELKNEDLLYSYLDEYLDGELTPDVLAKIEPLLQTPEYSGLPGRFQALRGKLQLAMQSYYLKEDELTALNALVMPPSEKQKAEQTSIDALSRGNTNSFYRRGAVLLLIVLAIGASIWKFGRTKDQKFRPLEYLGYEALAMEEDAQERLNLPSHDPVEVRQYLESYPGLEFKAQMLAGVPAGWQIDGATVIDYEVAKVAAVMYERGGAKTKELFFFFSFAGELSDLPASEPGNMRGLIFQTYASNELNLVAWQVAPGVVALLVGRRSAPELAEIALASRAAKE